MANFYQKQGQTARIPYYLKKKAWVGPETTLLFLVKLMSCCTVRSYCFCPIAMLRMPWIERTHNSMITEKKYFVSLQTK